MLEGGLCHEHEGWMDCVRTVQQCVSKKAAEPSGQGAFRVPTALILEFNDKIFSFKPGVLRSLWQLGIYSHPVVTQGNTREVSSSSSCDAAHAARRTRTAAAGAERN